MTTAALVAAVETYSRPLALRRIRTGQLPSGILDVIKIAAQDEATIADAMETTGLKREVLVESATFYLQKLLLDAGTNSYGLLCLSEGATQKEINSHKRWLLKWLHPDRNKNKWESVLFARVSQAATAVGQQGPTNAQLVTNAPQAQMDGSNAPGRHSMKRSREHLRVVRRRKIVFYWREILRRNAMRACALLAMTGAAAIVYWYSLAR